MQISTNLVPINEQQYAKTLPIQLKKVFQLTRKITGKILAEFKREKLLVPSSGIRNKWSDFVIDFFRKIYW